MTIAEVSKKFEISSYTLRYYEDIGVIPPVRRNKSGIRDYRENDLEWIEFIKCMRIAGIAIEVLAEYTELFMQGEETIQIRSEILVEQRNQLITKVEELKKTIDKINCKIEVYKNKSIVNQIHNNVDNDIL